MERRACLTHQRHRIEGCSLRRERCSVRRPIDPLLDPFLSICQDTLHILYFSLHHTLIQYASAINLGRDAYRDEDLLSFDTTSHNRGGKSDHSRAKATQLLRSHFQASLWEDTRKRTGKAIALVADMLKGKEREYDQ